MERQFWTFITIARYSHSDQIDGFCGCRIAGRGHHVLAQCVARKSRPAHQSGHAFSTDADLVIVRHLRMEVRPTIRITRTTGDGGDLQVSMPLVLAPQRRQLPCDNGDSPKRQGV